VITVSELVAHLDERVPCSWAYDWDRVGLLAGSGEWQVRRIFAAVDPSRDTLARAQDAGANVLLTHHPAFLDPLDAVVSGKGSPGLVFEALRLGIALVNCHTNMDRAPEGADALPDVLGLEMAGPLEPQGDDVLRPRMGRICPAPEESTLGTLASVVAARLGVRPRVWGPRDALVRRVAVAPGSGRSLVAAAMAAGCEALLTGELRYHEAHDALEAGLLVIEAGHDATERPLTRALAAIASSAPGLAADAVVVDDAPYPWWIS
jgi:dinuclear metal center YbgI/SA1388 family protein